MKVLVVIFLLISTKSAFGTHGRLSRGMLPSPQRRLFPLSHSQRERSNVARSIYLRRLLLDRLMSVYYQNCPNEEKLPSFQKLPSVPKFQTPPGFRNDMVHTTMRNLITTNGSGKRYFINPNIIIMSPIMKIVQTSGNNFQKKTINKQNPPQYFRRESKNKEIAKAADTKKKESFRTENLKDFQPFAAKANQNISKFEENQTISAEAKVLDGFSHPNTVKLRTVTYPTPNLFSLVRPNWTQTYEVEEILEDTINVDNFYEMNKKNEAYFENELQTTSNEKQVVENTLKSITTEVMEPNSQPTENTLTVVSKDTERTKTPFVQTSASGQFQNTKVLQSGKNVLISGTETPSNLKTLQVDSSRGSIQHSDRFPFRKFGKEQGVRQPANKIYANSNLTPSVSTSGFTYGETKKPTTETNSFETATRTFFGFFTKKPFLSKWGKPAAKPKNLDLDSLNPFENLPDKDLQIDSLVKNDSEPELTTGSTTEATFTTPTLVDDVTSNPFIRAVTPPATFPGDQITVEISTDISNVPKVRQSPRMSSPSLSNPDITKPNLEKFLDESLLIDLLPLTIKPDLNRDQESHEKYSRKLHFDRDTQKEITFNGITDKQNQEPRRSDILITEDLIENKNNENRISTVSYLEMLKAKDAMSTVDSPSNAKMESYIPFMLEILNDIRENKISRENLSLLSNVFWKYWPKILELANNTKLDVLPLATMKSEKDFVAFLENLSSRSETITTEAQTDDSNTYQETDDYDYKDFYSYD